MELLILINAVASLIFYLWVVGWMKEMRELSKMQARDLSKMVSNAEKHHRELMALMRGDIQDAAHLPGIKTQ